MHLVQIHDLQWSCVGKDTILLPEIPGDSLRIWGDSSFCQGNTTTLFASPNYVNYSWSNAANLDSIVTNQLGWIWVDATYTNGCVFRDSLYLQHYPQPSLALDSVHRGCTNGASSLTLSCSQGTPTYQYALDNQALQNNNGFFNAISDGIYIAKVQDANGCRDSISVNIAAYPPINFQISGDSLICFGQVNTLSGPVGNYQYSWSNGSINPQVLVTNTGLFSTYNYGHTWLQIYRSNACYSPSKIEFINTNIR